jgi:hypothetical protein
MIESVEYQHTLTTLRRIAKQYPNTSTIGDWRCFDADAQRAMGPGVGFELADDDKYKAMVARVEKVAKGAWLHPDSLRFFREDSLIFVRRPNCSNCGEVYHEHHGTDAKCLFSSTNYNDFYAPLLKAVSRT